MSINISRSTRVLNLVHNTSPIGPGYYDQDTPLEAYPKDSCAPFNVLQDRFET